jgi:hypothetical protein
VASRSIFSTHCLQVKRPILPKRYLHSLRFFLDGISPRKYPTTFFLECTAVEAVYTYCERGIPRALTQPSCLVWTIIRGHVSEFIPIYGPQGLRGMEAPALAGGPCTDLQSCPPAFLAISSVTVHALQRLVSSFEAVLQAQMACCNALYHVRMHLTL